MPLDTTPNPNDRSRWLLYKILTVLNTLPANITAASNSTKCGSQDITNGSNTVTVTFPTPFSSVPIVTASISRPSTDPIIAMNIDEASITVAGFTASLGGAAPNANYKIKWFAK